MTRCPFTRKECGAADKCIPKVTSMFVPVDPLAEQEQTTGPSLLDALLDEIRKQPRTSRSSCRGGSGPCCASRPSCCGRRTRSRRRR
jgi:hypothetical protein